MSCLFGCFGFKNCSRRILLLFYRIFLWKKNESALPWNQCVSLASYKEKKATPSKKVERQIFQEEFYGTDFVPLEQMHEVKLRQIHGSRLDNHVELQKASDRRCGFFDKCNNINWDLQLDESCHLLSRVLRASSVSREKSKSCQLLEHDDDKSTKTVMFEEIEHFKVEKDLNYLTLNESPRIENQMQSYIVDSPFPTPLNLVAEMQTPGTVRQSKPENFGIRAIRTQFAYPIPALSEQFLATANIGRSEGTQELP